MSLWRKLRRYLGERWIARLPLQAECRLEHNRIYLLPTRLGWWMVIVALAVWVGALNYAVSLAYVLAFWIAGLMLISVAISFRHLLGLRVHVLAPSPVFMGDTAEFTVVFTNEQGIERVIGVKYWQSDEAVSPVSIDAFEQSSIKLGTTALRRGYMVQPVLRVTSTMPLGLFAAWAYVRCDCQTLVYPAPYAHAVPIDSRKQPITNEYRSVYDDELAFIDEYKAGDSMRHIVWKVLARQDKLVSKRFQSDNLPGVIRLNWDDYPDALDVECRLSYLTWRVLQCYTKGQPFVLSLPGGRVLSDSDSQQVLATLACWEQH